MVYVCNETQLSHKNNKILPFVATWIELESVMLSEISQTERQILYDFTYMWNLKKKTNENTKLRDTKNKLVVVRGKVYWGV